MSEINIFKIVALVMLFIFFQANGCAPVTAQEQTDYRSAESFFF